MMRTVYMRIGIASTYTCYNLPRITMSPKTLIWIGIFVGGTIGGYVPTLWGADLFSFSSIIGNTIGGIAGIWAGWKLSQMF